MTLTIAEVLAIATRHVGGEMVSSARICLADARRLAETDPARARTRALKSLAYSVGTTHPAYELAC